MDVRTARSVVMDAVQGVLIRDSDDIAKLDKELVCGDCNEVLVDVEDGDYLEVLVAVALDHVTACTGSK
ncbi:hypothetical protein ABZY93_22215 [Streptomyces smyrnaeus]|uniref:hypothetical protein n=1 Tax=Streptomyces smyrnaeus TaxID=1387713 RepID=UPI00339F360F